MRLKSGQISPIGLAALAIGVMSPAIGLFALWGPMQAAAGPISPLVYLASALFALPTAWSYAQLNAEAPSVGAASTWLWRAVSPSAGYLVGLTMLAYFLFATIAQPLLFAVFFRDLLRLCGGPAESLWILVVAVPLISVPVMIAAYRGAEASTRMAVTLMIVESTIVVALSATILWVKRAEPSGINLHAFEPSQATHGFGGFWTAMLLGILAYCGFDVVSTAAEETNSPKEHVPKAILLTILGITLFWAANAWVYTLGLPHDQVVAYTATGDTAVTPLADLYWGWGRVFVLLTSITGICAVYISCALGTSRIIFALARHRLLPAALGQLHGPKGIPRAALHAVFGFTLVGGVITILALRNGLSAFTWWANALVFFATLTFTAVNIANVCYFHRIARARRRIMHHVIVPVFGAVVTLYVMYQTFFVALMGADFATGRSVVYACVALLVILVVMVLAVGRVSPSRLQGPAPVEAPDAPDATVAADSVPREIH